jgi:hypothetical protein
MLEGERRGRPEDDETMGVALAEDLRARGADVILAALAKT